MTPIIISMHFPEIERKSLSNKVGSRESHLRRGHFSASYKAVVILLSHREASSQIQSVITPGDPPSFRA